METSQLGVGVGRILLGGMFVVVGLLNARKMTPLSARLAERGVPLLRASLAAAIVFQIAAGLAFAAGIAMTYAAAGLIAFTLVASLVMIRVPPQEPARTAAINGWLSNLAVIGGLLIAAATAHP